MPNLIDDLRRTYTVPVICGNCAYIFNLVIPKGVLMEDYFKSNNAFCRNCGCKTLKKYKPFWGDNPMQESFWDECKSIKQDIESNYKGGDKDERKKQKNSNGHRRRRNRRGRYN